MKKITFLLPAVVFIMASPSAFSQKYKTAADTVQLNKEYVEVSNDIADLTSKLTIAQNNLPGYKTKAVEAGTNAGNAASNSSDQASKAMTSPRAKRKAAREEPFTGRARSAQNDSQLKRLGLGLGSACSEDRGEGAAFFEF